MIVHALTVKDRVIDIEPKTAVQYNANNDFLSINLDGEWQDKEVYIIFDEGNKAIACKWDGSELVSVPPQVMNVAGYHEVTIMGLSKDGESRLVTEKSPRAFKVNSASDVVEAVKNV